MSVNAAGTGGYPAAGQFAALAGLIRSTISIAYGLSFATLILRSAAHPLACLRHRRTFPNYGNQRGDRRGAKFAAFPACAP